MKKIGFWCFLTFSACTTNEIAADAERYCHCKRMEEPKAICQAILEELNEKYAFDPRGAEELTDEIVNCLPAAEK